LFPIADSGRAGTAPEKDSTATARRSTPGR
jgi:hypothetical protein